jgi:hypothetical protein
MAPVKFGAPSPPAKGILELRQQVALRGGVAHADAVRADLERRQEAGERYGRRSFKNLMCGLFFAHGAVFE